MDLLNRMKSKMIIGLAFGFLVIVGLAMWADLNQVKYALSSFQWNLAPVILMFVFGAYLLRFWKWHLYMNELEIQITKRLSAQIFFSGLAMAVTPGKFGEVLKAYLLKRVNGTDFFRSAPTVVAERVTDLMAMLFIASFGVSIFKNGTIIMILGTAIVCMAIFMIAYRPLALKIVNILEQLPLLGRFGDRIKALYESTYVLLRGPILIKAFLVSLISWGFECIALYMIFKGYGIDKGFMTAAFVFSLSSVAGGLSMLPGGLGVAEGSMLGLLISMGVDKTSATGITLLARFGTLWFGVVVGIITLWFNRKRFGITNDSNINCN